MNTDRMDTLRRRIAALEARPILAESAPPPGTDQSASLPVLLPGEMQEIFADERRNAAAALGFALALARPRLSADRPALLYLHLQGESQELGLPYGPGLSSFGLDPCSIVFGQTKSIGELLWAMEEAIACRAVAGVIADLAAPHKALDFTASRRLSLRAASARAAVLLVRYGREREASAARRRWHIAPLASSPAPYDARAPGRPRWRVELEKGTLGRSAARQAGFLLDWTENGLERIADDHAAIAPRSAAAAAASGAASAALGHRLSQAG